MKHSGSLAPILPAVVLPVAFAAYFKALVLLGVEARPGAAAVLAFFALYLCLGGCLTAALALGQHLGRVVALAAGFGVGLVLVWHCREITYRPGSFFWLLVCAAILAPILEFLSRGLALTPTTLKKSLVVLGGMLGMTAVTVVLIFYSSGVLRWQLLRHHKMLGTPAYYLLATPVADLERDFLDPFRNSDPVEFPETAVGGDDTTAQPNLVFILLDTLRADALAMTGGDPEQMPRLNTFLDGAWRFTDVTANASWTRPSMASMFTGLQPEEHGARDVNDPLADEHETLAERLVASGYETAALVTNVGAVGRSAGFAQGFDLFHELTGEPYARAAKVHRAVEGFLQQRQNADGLNPEKPLFLYLHYLDPHEPYLAGDVPRVKNRASYTAAYRAELEYLDGHLAKTIELLRRELGPTTAFLVTSDHGEEFFEHEEFGHGYSLYQEVVHVPAALWLGDDGGDLNVPLEGRDLFDLVSLWADGELQLPAWAEERSRRLRWTSIYYSSEGRLLLRPYLAKVFMRAVKADGYKLVWSAYGDTWELYDMTADPGEQRNLAASRPDVVARLQEQLWSEIGFWTFPPPYERTAEETQQLRDLGYLD